MRNRLIFDGGFDGGFVNFWDGFYSYTIFYLLKSGLFMQKNNLTTYALAKNQGFKTLKKFASALDVSTDDLLTEKEKTVEISEEIGVEFAKLTKDGQITIRNMMKFLQSQQMAG